MNESYLLPKISLLPSPTLHQLQHWYISQLKATKPSNNLIQYFPSIWYHIVHQRSHLHLVFLPLTIMMQIPSYHRVILRIPPQISDTTIISNRSTSPSTIEADGALPLDYKQPHHYHPSHPRVISLIHQFWEWHQLAHHYITQLKDIIEELLLDNHHVIL